MSYEYEGSYIARGNRLKRSDGKTLLVSHRANPSPRKPARFLVDKTDGAGDYVSSIYDDHRLPEFESRGVRYAMRWAGDRVQIVAKGPRTPKWSK